ncbi:MAG: ABC transporter permease [Solidesulfovibrio sp.]|uniref:ABC transporter permease n=1 Tax=Solidesulfovibrio sp. TaxID=2910990 RepID=UPI00315977E3
MPNWAYVFAETTGRRRRTWAAVSLTILAVSVFLGVRLTSASFQAAFRAPLDDIGASLTVQRSGDVPQEMAGPVLPCSLAPITAAEIADIKRLDGVLGVSESVLFWDFEPDKFVIMAGFRPSDQAGLALLQKVLAGGRFLEPGDQDKILLESQWATEQKLGPGDRLVLQGNAYEIVGLVESSRLSQLTVAQVYLPLDTARRMTAASPGVTGTHAFTLNDSNLLFVKAARDRSEDVRRAIVSRLGEKASVTSPESFKEVVRGLLKATDRFAWAVSLLTIVIAALFIARTAISNVHERRKEFGVMRAVGWTGRDITLQFFAETLVQALISAPLGLAAGALVMVVLPLAHVAIPIPWDMTPKPHFMPGGAEQLFRDVPLSASLSLEMAGQAVLLAVGVALLGAFVGIRASLSLKPSEALRHE